MADKRIFNLVDSEVQKWKNFTLGETTYDFSHLNACKHTFQHPERNEHYVLFFTFSHHVFTTEIKVNDIVDDALIYPSPKDKRVFDITRFELSKHLPNIIKTLPDQFCYHGGYSRYCNCKITQGNGSDIEYQVVYRVWKTRDKMRFHVESAYPLEKPLGKVKKVNFWTICHNLLAGKKMPAPPMG